MIERLNRALRETAKTLLRPFFRRARSSRPDLFWIRIVRPQEASAAAAGAVETARRPEVAACDLADERMSPPGPEAGQRFVNYDPARVAAVLDIIASFDGAPDVEVLEDVVYLPRHHCLYDETGRKIERTHQRAETTRAPDRVRLPARLAVHEDEIAYVGHVSNHYGHFISEGTGLLWYAEVDPRVPLLTHELDRFSLAPGFLDDFFAVAGDLARRLVAFDRPTLLKRVVLPTASFLSRPRREVYAAHRRLPERVARGLLPTLPAPTDQPLYLSRTRLAPHQRKIWKEDELEKELRRVGCAIVHPEDFGFTEQIALLHRHSTVVACLGSALHSFVFDLSRRIELIAFAYRDAPHPNYLMVDALKGVRSTYVAALDEDETSSKDYSHRDRTLDLDVAIGVLEQANIL